MTISSSLNAGVMGLNVNATRLATISDNIANSETYGYKRSDVDFSSMVVRQEPSVYAAGGVRTTVYKDITSTSSLISTGSSTDIAISGNGMIPVTNAAGVDESPAERDLLMVPTGSFSTDENGYLKTNSGLFLLGWPTGPFGETSDVSRGTGESLEPINTNVGQFNAEPTRNISLGVNLPADLGDNTDPYVLPIEYYDSLGVVRSLTTTFTPDNSVGAAPFSWNVSMTDSAGDGVSSIADFSVIFTPIVSGGASVSVTAGAGTTYDATTGEIAFNVDGGPISMLVGGSNVSGGLSQIGTDFSPSNITQDGSPIGDLQSIEITESGFLEAVYNTGFRRTLYQVPIADVPNTNGLEARGNQAYSISNDSGDLYLWNAGDGPSGTFSGYTLMESNSNIAAELTSLIETQRAYSSNAKIIQTVDEMLQETTNLKR